MKSKLKPCLCRLLVQFQVSKIRWKSRHHLKTRCKYQGWFKFCKLNISRLRFSFVILCMVPQAKLFLEIKSSLPGKLKQDNSRCNYNNKNDHFFQFSLSKCPPDRHAFTGVGDWECQTTRPLDNSSQTTRPRSSDSIVDKRTNNNFFGSR